jgi:hypothetical protein
MSKQNLIVIIVVIISLVTGGLFGFYFYLSHKNGEAISRGIPTSNGFFNIGSTQTPPTPNPSEVTDTATTTETVAATVPRPIPQLRHLTLAPVAGSAFISKDILAVNTSTVGTSTKAASKVIGSVEVIRWVDRTTGKIYETSSSTLEVTRISNTTIPKIYEASFVDKKGQGIVFRDIFEGTDVIRTRYGLMRNESSTSSEQLINMTDLDNNITQLAISPAGESLFSILPTDTRGVLSRPDGSNKTNIFESPFHEWLVSWPSLRSIVLNTKPSGTTEGFAYLLDPQTRSITKLVGDIKGLTTLLSPDGTKLLIGESIPGTTEIHVLDRKTGEKKNLGIRTFPEKCVWSKKEVSSIYCAVPENIQYDIYPDAWYMGRISFSDSIWKINTETGESRLLAQPIYIVGQSIDILNLSLNSAEEFLLFQDKNDLSLWSYKLETSI